MKAICLNNYSFKKSFLKQETPQILINFNSTYKISVDLLSDFFPIKLLKLIIQMIQYFISSYEKQISQNHYLETQLSKLILKSTNYQKQIFG
jgi:hypothetical protein